MSTPRIDPHSATWHAVVAHIETRLANQRRALEATGLSAIETEHLRGAILELRRMLAIGEIQHAPMRAFE